MGLGQTAHAREGVPEGLDSWPFRDEMRSSNGGSASTMTANRPSTLIRMWMDPCLSSLRMKRTERIQNDS